MSVLDELIRIKTNTQEDDLIKILDEISIYEKLSVNEKFKDLKNSEITRTKCPILAAFIDGKLYETVLAELAANVYLQIEGQIPNILLNASEKTPKQQKQLAILQNGITHVSYRELTEYEHESMKDFVVAVFTKQCEENILAVIIVKTPNGYVMYHGDYTVNETEKYITNIYEPVIVKGQRGTFTMKSYSILGNNGYRFGSYKNENNSLEYDVMIGFDGELYLMDGERAVVTCLIPYEERNVLNMVKKDPERFASNLTSIIESVI